MSGLSISTKNEKSIHSPMLPRHSIILWGSFRGQREEKWGSFRGRFGDHFRVGDHFGVGIISGAVQISKSIDLELTSLFGTSKTSTELNVFSLDSFRQLGNEEEIRRAPIYFGACT